MAAKQLDKDRDGTSLNNDLCLLCRARGNVGQGPRGLELNEGMRRSEKLDESADDASLDDFLNRGISLLGE